MATPQGGLSSIAEANPTAYNPLLQQDIVNQVRSATAQMSPTDEFNNYVRSTRPDPTQLQQAQQDWQASQATQAESQQQNVEQLKQNVSPERATSLNWQALGNMGAAMLATPNNAWGAGAEAYMGARGKNQATLDASGVDLRTAEQGISDTDVANKQAMYLALRKQQEDALKYQQEVLKAQHSGGQEWTFVKDEKGIYAANKLDPGKSHYVTKTSFINQTMTGFAAIDKELSDNADAIHQQAVKLGVEPSALMESLRTQRRDEFKRQNPNPFDAETSGDPYGSLSPVQPQVQGAEQGQVQAPQQAASQTQNQAPYNIEVALGTTPEGLDNLKMAAAADNRRPYKGFTEQERATLAQRAAVGDQEAAQLFKMDAAYRAKRQANPRPQVASKIAMPVLDKPSLEGSVTTAKDTAAGDVKKVFDKPTQLGAYRGAMSTLDQMINTVDEVLQHPGLARATGPLGMVKNFPGSPAADAEAMLHDTLRAKIMMQQLAAMRAASPTGGALGNVSDKEGELLASSLAALGKEQSSSAILAHLRTIRDITQKAKLGLSQRLKDTYTDVNPDEIYSQEFRPTPTFDYGKNKSSHPKEITDLVDKYSKKRK